MEKLRHERPHSNTLKSFDSKEWITALIDGFPGDWRFTLSENVLVSIVCRWRILISVGSTEEVMLCNPIPQERQGKNVEFRREICKSFFWWHAHLAHND